MVEVLWSEFNYRCRHETIKLHYLMLTGEFKRRLDGKLVQFTRGYIVWRLSNLLGPIAQHSIEEAEKIVGEYLQCLKERTTKDIKQESSSLNTQ